jgi:hypothetical protein
MKRIVFLVLTLVFAFLVIGCNNKGKDTELVTTGGASGDPTSVSTGTPDSATGSTTGTEGTTPMPGTTGTAGSTTGSATAGSGVAPTENASIDESGAMVKHSEGKPAPAGQVWCDNCKGHLPKEDAVTSGGKTYCMACAEELKIKQ